MSPDSHLLIRKLEGFATLSDSDKRALDGVVAAARTSVIAADRDIVPEGERMSDCALILEGFACRYTILQNGRRQIMSFHIPGDICDLHGLLMGTLDHGIGTLTATTWR